MKTAALALFAAAVNADTASDAINQAECDGYLWGLMLLGWSCQAETDNNLNWSCTMTEANPNNLVSTDVDSTSVAWSQACSLDSGVWIAPNEIKGSDAKCEAWMEAKGEGYVVTEADMLTLSWA